MKCVSWNHEWDDTDCLEVIAVEIRSPAVGRVTSSQLSCCFPDPVEGFACEL